MSLGRYPLLDRRALNRRSELLANAVAFLLPDEEEDAPQQKRVKRGTWMGRTDKTLQDKLPVEQRPRVKAWHKLRGERQRPIPITIGQQNRHLGSRKAA